MRQAPHQRSDVAALEDRVEPGVILDLGAVHDAVVVGEAYRGSVVQAETEADARTDDSARPNDAVARADVPLEIVQVAHAREDHGRVRGIDHREARLCPSETRSRGLLEEYVADPAAFLVDDLAALDLERILAAARLEHDVADEERPAAIRRVELVMNADLDVAEAAAVGGHHRVEIGSFEDVTAPYPLLAMNVRDLDADLDAPRKTVTQRERRAARVALGLADVDQTDGNGRNDREALYRHLERARVHVGQRGL